MSKVLHISGVAGKMVTTKDANVHEGNLAGPDLCARAWHQSGEGDMGGNWFRGEVFEKRCGMRGFGGAEWSVQGNSQLTEG